MCLGKKLVYLVYFHHLHQQGGQAGHFPGGFTNGSSVTGSNVPGDPSDVAPGQSATAEVDALSKSGSDVAFNGCDIMTYTVLSDSGETPGEYAG